MHVKEIGMQTSNVSNTSPDIKSVKTGKYKLLNLLNSLSKVIRWSYTLYVQKIHFFEIYQFGGSNICTFMLALYFCRI
jgi:hypothetical protein